MLYQLSYARVDSILAVLLVRLPVLQFDAPVADKGTVRSTPTTPLAHRLWPVGVVACVLMALGATVAGLVLLGVAVAVAITLRLTGVR
jgi:hypothetical protein